MRIDPVNEPEQSPGGSGGVAGLPDARPVLLVCGLKNPDARYAPTRHNAGDWLIDRLAAVEGLDFTQTGEIPARHAKTAAGVRIASSLTYMNHSGQAAAGLARYFRIDAASVLVAHDEIDLPPGAVRLKFGGGLAGHNGLRSVAKELGTNDFWRLRIGVGHPAAVELADDEATASVWQRQDVADYVLMAPQAAEREQIDAAIDAVVAVWPAIAAGDMDQAMRELHSRKGI